MKWPNLCYSFFFLKINFICDHLCVSVGMPTCDEPVTSERVSEPPEQELQAL